MDWWFSRRPDSEARVTREVPPAITELHDNLLIGEYPRESDIPWLREQHGVTGVHNLQDDDDLRIHGLDIDALHVVCRRHGVKLVRTPIHDGSSDDMAARLGDALAALRQLLRESRRVYLHCNAGMNRAPTLAIAYLRAECGMSLDEALAYVKARRACGPFMTVLEEHFGARDYKPGT
jgi:protein-tyrosine phosphatase